MSRQERFATARGISRGAIFRGFGAGAALAWTCGVLVCAQAGCMVPQSVDPIVTSPHEPPTLGPANLPQYLLARVLTLYQNGTADVTSSPPCHCQLAFGKFDAITVEEADSTVTLEARWFIDYDSANPASTAPRLTETLDAIPNNVDKTTRTLTKVFDFDAAIASATTNGLHIVELVVGQKDGFNDSSTSLPNRAMKPDFQSATWKFVIDLHLEQIPGTCPSTPPSDRVCP
jgi:hypothetical protein